MLRCLLRLLVAVCMACSGSLVVAADRGCCGNDCVDAWACVAAPCQTCAAQPVAMEPRCLPPLLAPAAAPLLAAVASHFPAPGDRIWTPPD